MEEPGLFIDDDLKLILKAAKFDNLASLSNLSEGDIKTMEDFMKSTLHKIVKMDEKASYYGIFESRPEEFQFVCVQLKSLKILATRAKTVLASSVRKPGSGVKPKPVSENDVQQQEKTQKQKEDEQIVKLKRALVNSVKLYLSSHFPELNDSDGEIKVDCDVAPDGFNSFTSRI